MSMMKKMFKLLINRICSKKNGCLKERVKGELSVQMLDVASEPAAFRESNWSLFNDSVPTHPATTVKHFLANRSVVEVSCQR